MDWNKYQTEAEQEIQKIDNIKELEEWKGKFFGRRSALSLFFENLKNIPLEERKVKAKEAQKVKEFLFLLYQKKKEELEKKESSFDLDITRPGLRPLKTHFHPLTLIIEEIIEIFKSLGFEIVEGPEIETEYYNFDALRIPEFHPARDMWDTLWLNFSSKGERLLLRTHTSPVQIRYMESHKPPFRIIVPGRTFRHEATDAYHEIQFHQIEGLMVSNNISFSNFKFIVEEFFKTLFRGPLEIRFRPSYFPFVTPGVEVDIKLPNFEKTKTRQSYKTNNKSEWLEVMGAGMVHPELFKIVGYKEKNLWGFAFGLGVERIAMIKYKIPDIRLFHNPDIRFLKQF